MSRANRRGELRSGGPGPRPWWG